MNWEIEFFRRFVADTDNGRGPTYIFRINSDGTRSIALLTDLLAFIRNAMKEKDAEILRLCIEGTDILEEMQVYKLKIEEILRIIHRSP
jgi:hypothetical protein